MAKRYGKAVKGVCQICGNKGKTEIHHIISKAKIGRIKKGEHNYDQDLMKNQGNLVELCIPCHEQTDSHVYWRWYQKNSKNSAIRSEIQKAVQMSDSEKEKFGYKGVPSASRRRTRRRNQCKGVKADGNRCGQKNRAIPKDGYCYSHKDQAPEGHSHMPFQITSLHHPRAYTMKTTGRKTDSSMLNILQHSKISECLELSRGKMSWNSSLIGRRLGDADGCTEKGGSGIPTHVDAVPLLQTILGMVVGLY